MSTLALRAMMPLRMRARKSAIGSVMFLPATLDDARHLALERERAEAQTAQVELAHIGAGPAAQRTAVTVADLPLLLARDLLSQTSHGLPRFPTGGTACPDDGAAPGLPRRSRPKSRSRC